MTLVETLRACHLFKGLTEEEIDRIANISREESYPSGAIVFSEGGVATNLYVVKEGRVALDMKIQLGSRTPRDSTIEVLSSGSAFGWSAVVPPYIYTFSASCLEPVKLVAIDGGELRHLIEIDCCLGVEVLKQINATIAKRSNETRERLEYFVSIVSHELKAPLAAIESYLQVMLGGFTGEITEKQRNMLERCSLRIRELIGLISDLVDSSRLEYRHIAQDIEKSSLRDILDRSLEDTQAYAREKNIALNVDIPAALPPMYLAPGRMRQVFTNLLSNAIKYTPSAGTVTIKVVETSNHVQVEVIDTGIGIPRSELPRIFEEFYRAANVESKGAGLGLSIAKKIVEAHSGRIWAESPYPPDSGKGSRFCVLLAKTERSQPGHRPAVKANRQQ